MGKTAIVTGGSRGIGYGVAKRLAEDGFNIVIAATKREEECMDQLAWFKDHGFPCLYVQARVDNRDDRRRIVDETVSRFGGIHVLVNNAGVAPLQRADLLEMTEESFDRVMNINLKSNVFLSRLVARQMLSQELEGKKRGTIINISSCSADVVSVNRGEYCISKAGIAMSTKLFAARLAKESILVHEIRPGVIFTDMTSGVREKYSRLVDQGIFPISRWGLPEDVAGAVSAFCSDDFTYTTGNYVDVDGGFHIKQL